MRKPKNNSWISIFLLTYTSLQCKTENCRGRCTYYARKSSDAVSVGKKFSVEYGDSCVDTHVYTDTFEFAGLKVKDMPFGGAYRMSGFGTGFGE